MSGEALPEDVLAQIANPAPVEAPGQDLPPPNPEQAKAAAAAFAQQGQASGVFALWSAGMLLNELLHDFSEVHLADEEAKKKRQPAE